MILAKAFIVIVIAMLVQSRVMLRTAMRSRGVGRLFSSVLTSDRDVLAPHSQPPVYMPTNIEKTGTFMKQLPEIYAADIYFKRAMKTTRDIKLDPEIKNIRNAHRKQAAMVMDALMKGLTVPLTQVIDTYKKGLKSMHPYEVRQSKVYPPPSVLTFTLFRCCS